MTCFLRSSLLGLSLVYTHQRLAAIKLSKIPAAVSAWIRNFPLLLTHLQFDCWGLCSLRHFTQHPTRNEFIWVLVCRQKTFRAEIRKYHCSANLNWQPLCIVLFQGKLFSSLSEINYQLLTLSIEKWFCCNSKKIIFLWFISLCKAVAWEYWMHFPVFLSISVLISTQYSVCACQ